MEQVIPIIIPSLEPDERLIQLMEEINEAQLGPVIVVNDGSSIKYDHFFEKVQNDFAATVIKHDKNMGKGKALKTAFLYCIKNVDRMIGCITVDSDGQHTTEAIMDVRNQLVKTPDAIVIGVRDFDLAGIPSKSQFGNNLTRKVFRTLYKKDITDTQTGLRAIPMPFMQKLLSVSGDRFEFETRMLIKAVEEGINIKEIPIETIYDSKEDHSTHFRPIVDSIRIYRVFGFAFGKYLISSLSSSIFDLFLFQLFCTIFKNRVVCINYIVAATVVARIISALYNYSMNYFYVFKSKKKHLKSALKYFILAVLQLTCSAIFTTELIRLTGVELELLIKIPVDVVLFLISYQIQKKFIFGYLNIE